MQAVCSLPSETLPRRAAITGLICFEASIFSFPTGQSADPAPLRLVLSIVTVFHTSGYRVYRPLVLPLLAWDIHIPAHVHGESCSFLSVSCAAVFLFAVLVDLFGLGWIEKYALRTAMIIKQISSSKGSLLTQWHMLTVPSLGD